MSAYKSNICRKSTTTSHSIRAYSSLALMIKGCNLKTRRGRQYFDGELISPMSSSTPVCNNNLFPTINKSRKTNNRSIGQFFPIKISANVLYRCCPEDRNSRIKFSYLSNPRFRSWPWVQISDTVQPEPLVLAQGLCFCYLHVHKWCNAFDHCWHQREVRPGYACISCWALLSSLRQSKGVPYAM